MFIRRENFRQYLKMYPTVSVLIAMNLIVFIIQLLPVIGEIVFWGGMSINGYIAEGQWWRVLTSMFLHADFFHLLFNMFSLFLFGPELEKIAGKMRFLTIYFLSGIFGSVVTFVIQPLDYASVGASGAIYGIFGAFVALVYYTRHTFPQLKQIILPIVVIGVIMTFLQSGINVASHLGGLVTGFVFGLFYFRPKNMLRWRNR